MSSFWAKQSFKNWIVSKFHKQLNDSLLHHEIDFIEFEKSLGQATAELGLDSNKIYIERLRSFVDKFSKDKNRL